MMNHPRPPTWVHDDASHPSLLTGVEPSLPAGSGPILPSSRMSQYDLNKELPAIPSSTSNLAPAGPPPEIPPYNPLRFSQVTSKKSPTECTAMLPDCHSISSAESSSGESLLSQPHGTEVPKIPKTLRLLGHPTLTIKAPTYGQTNKVQQLTGYDLASPTERRHHRKSSLGSETSTSSYYSDPEIHFPSRQEGDFKSEGHVSLPHAAKIDQHHIFNNAHDDVLVGTKKRPSPSKITFDDFIRRECARFEHDTTSPTTSIVHSPVYSTQHSISSVPPASLLPEASYNGEFTLPLRLRTATDNRPPSRFSDESAEPSLSPTTRLAASIRNSMQSLASHSPFGLARSSSRDGESRDGMKDERDEGDESTKFKMPLGGAAVNKPGAGKDGKRKRGSELMRRISDAVFPKRVASMPKSIGGAMMIVIPDHRRRIDGPDTPFPRYANGRVPLHETLVGRRGSVREAVGRVTESRWVVGGRERTRERLREHIKFVGIEEAQEDVDVEETRRL